MKNTVYTRFAKFIREKALFKSDERILLALSGGVDSVVMAHLFHRAGFKFGIAHCNFQLRGRESLADEAFAKELAAELEVPFYTERFDTKAYAAREGISIQMAARDLRYAWFDKLVTEHQYQYLATAHHKDDLAETVLLNLVKGSVLRGLHGILPKSGHVIRPLLWAGKDEIEDYAAFRQMEYREDKSNAESKYQRNLVRNEIIPLLRKINPNLAETIFHSAERRYQLENWIDEYSGIVKPKIVKPLPDGLEVAIADIKAYNIKPEIFFQWIEEYGFEYVQAEALFASLDQPDNKIFYTSYSAKTSDTDTPPGKMYHHSQYRMIKDRNSIIVSSYLPPNEDKLVVGPATKEAAFEGKNFSFELMDTTIAEHLKGTSAALLDVDTLQFPLTIRRWKAGDYFQPFGMKGNKKISDFLTDLKMPFLDKESQLVVCSGDMICWLAGRRIADSFKMTAGTKKVLKIDFEVIDGELPHS